MKNLNNSSIDGSKPEINQSLYVGFRPSMWANEPDNDKYNQSKLQEVTLPYMVTILLAVVDRFGSLGLVRGFFNSLGIVKWQKRFLGQGEAVFKVECNFMSIPNKKTELLGESF